MITIKTEPKLKSISNQEEIVNSHWPGKLNQSKNVIIGTSVLKCLYSNSQITQLLDFTPRIDNNNNQITTVINNNNSINHNNKNIGNTRDLHSRPIHQCELPNSLEETVIFPSGTTITSRIMAHQINLPEGRLSNNHISNRQHSNTQHFKTSITTWLTTLNLNRIKSKLGSTSPQVHSSLYWLGGRSNFTLGWNIIN